MKFEFREALASLLAFVVLLAFVTVVVGAIGGYLMLVTLAGNWLSAHFANHPAVVFVTMIIVFMGIPVFFLGGLGVFKMPEIKENADEL